MEAGKGPTRREVADSSECPRRAPRNGSFVPYRISIQPAAQREQSKLPIDVRQNVADAISALANEPRPPGVRKVSGSKSSYRIRIGDYGVRFTIANRTLHVIVVMSEIDGTFTGHDPGRAKNNAILHRAT